MYRRSSLVIGVFLLLLFSLVAASALHYQTEGLARHPEDLKVHQLEKQKDGRFTHLLLSDSVTENATEGIAFSDDTLPVLTNGWLRLAGQFFLLRRAFEKNPLSDVDIFVVPDIFIIDVNDEGGGRIRYTYTDSLFTRPDEIMDLREAGDPKAGRHLIYLDVIFKSWHRVIDELPPRNRFIPPMPRPSAAAVTPAAADRINNRRSALSNFAITRQNTYFLKRINDLCFSNKLHCRIIIEPIPSSIRSIDWGEIHRLAPNIEWVDVNDFESFPDGAFYDGLHLKKPEWADYYVSLLTSRIMLPTAKPSPWDGHPLMFNRCANQALMHTEHLHEAEAWGQWTNGDASSIEINFTGNTLRPPILVVEGEILVSSRAQDITFTINGEHLCTHRVVKSGKVIIRCPLRGPLQQGFLKVDVRTSYSVVPKEDLGQPDSRSLGFGWKSLAIE